MKTTKILLVTGSVTTAKRLCKILSKKGGIIADTVQTPSAVSGGGCSYSVRIDERDLGKTLALAAEYSVKIRGVYTSNGGEYHALP